MSQDDSKSQPESKKRQTVKERYEIRRILYDEKHEGSGLRYDPDFHPKDFVRYFRARYDDLKDAERYATEHRLTYVAKPTRPPTLAGYAAEIHVGRGCMWDWAKKYEAFDLAVEECKAIQEAMVVELTAIGAYNPTFAAFMMKNLHNWQDKIEQTHRGAVTLNFDDEDEKA